MVTKNRCYEADSVLIQSAESKRKEVDIKAKVLCLQSQQQRQKLRNHLTGQSKLVQYMNVRLKTEFFG